MFAMGIEKGVPEPAQFSLVSLSPYAGNSRGNFQSPGEYYELIACHIQMTYQVQSVQNDAHPYFPCIFHF